MSTPTTLAEAIQAAWTADTVLSGLVPDSRCYIGKVPPAGNIGDSDPTTPEMPYCRVEIPAGAPGVRTNASIYASQSVIFHVWTDGFDQGDQIGQQIERVFYVPMDWTNGGTTEAKFDPHVTTQQDPPEIVQFETVCKFAMTTWQGRTDIQSSSSGS